ncbi:MAG: peptidase S8 [Verrucomicrobiaceae bacterium]|nr:MAG: peptidase S8 [Verrucomicrobiaceae bacterium]
MQNRFPILVPLAIGGLLALVLLLLLPRDWLGKWSLTGPLRRQFITENPPRPPQGGDGSGAETVHAPDLMAVDPKWAEASAAVMEMLRRRLEDKDARGKEALITFKDEAAYRRFLERAGGGLKVLGKLDDFNTVRVAYDSLDDLHKDILGNAADYGDISANYYAYMPDVPAQEERAAQTEVAFGDAMLPFLGVFGDHSGWGKGVTVAVLDSGVAADAGIPASQLKYIDIGLGTVGSGSEDGHGTAVGYLVNQVAPGADILSIRVTGADGVSDLFTLAQGIRTAVDSGVSAVNISLGAYQNSLVLSAAIAYAAERGVLVVAAGGNDQAAQLTWPAADARVVSVGAVDALGQQATFSNSGENLSLTAPGYGIYTPWLGGDRIVFDGTSASSPIVAGAIAALLSVNPGLTTEQAAGYLKQYSSDGGAPGADASYGSGILNLGWVMNSSNPNYFDTAVSSQYYNNRTGQMEIVVQNRSGQGVNGLQLQVSGGNGGTQNLVNLPLMAAGASYVVAVPIDQSAVNSASGASVQARLINPPGLTDAQPSNNQRASVISKK